MYIITSEKLPIKSWCKDVEEGAMRQVKNLANHPFAFKHICLMPDAHEGFGMPIGGVLATKEVILPNAVGVDIGCGMCAVKTSLKTPDLQDKKLLKALLQEIRSRIPLGFEHHKKKQPWPEILKEPAGVVSRREYDSAQHQIGTLGGGNHFIEIQHDTENNIWLMLHSGSRNIGKQVADYYNKLAKELNQKWNSPVPRNWDLAYLMIDSKEGQQYIAEMNYCLEFAKENRFLMLDRIKDIFSKKTSCDFDRTINIHHNYAVLETHFGQRLWIHRKGATSAYSGEIGIVPGSQGTPSYIVRGKGEKESYMSCSHGAGRVMSRTKAEKNLNLEEVIKNLDEKGIIHSIRSRRDLDEAPQCYKDIDVVMEEQKDLVDIVVKLKPLAVIKG